MARGYDRRGKRDWYKFFEGALVVVNLQRSAFGAGVYVNFGLSFLQGKRRRFPKEYDCDVFGRNPASFSTREKIRLQSLMDCVSTLLDSPKLLAELDNHLDLQIRCIEAWANKTVLRRRLENEESLDMLVNKRVWKRLVPAEACAK